MKKIFVIGGTGELGKSLVQKLLEQSFEIFLLVRRDNHQSVKEFFGTQKRLSYVIGDIKNPKIIENKNVREKIINEVDSIYHGAFCKRDGEDSTEFFLSNVMGTNNILHFAELCPKLLFFHFLSSVEVVGSANGEIEEDVLEYGQNFEDSFSHSKYEAELMVRKWSFPKAKIRIYRMGILLPDSSLPENPHYGTSGFFELLGKLKRKKLLLNTLKYLPLPFDKNSVLPIIPLWEATELLANAIARPQKKNKIRGYHIISDPCPTVGEFIQDSFDSFGFKVNVVPLPAKRANNVLLDKIGMAKELLPYNFIQCHFNHSNLQVDFPQMKKASYGQFKEGVLSLAHVRFSPGGKEL